MAEVKVLTILLAADGRQLGAVKDNSKEVVRRVQKFLREEHKDGYDCLEFTSKDGRPYYMTLDHLKQVAQVLEFEDEPPRAMQQNPPRIMPVSAFMKS